MMRGKRILVSKSSLSCESPLLKQAPPPNPHLQMRVPDSWLWSRLLAMLLTDLFRESSDAQQAHGLYLSLVEGQQQAETAVGWPPP